VSLNGGAETTETETHRATETLATAATARACAQCQKPFTPARADARFCSPACRLKAHRTIKAQGHGTSERYQEMKRQAEEAERQYAEAQARKPRKPSVYYSDAIADIIIERLERGEPLRVICSTEDMPDQAAVYKWAAEMPDTFGQRYVRARELGYLKMADELDDLADGSELGERRFESGVVQRHRLQVDTRRWILSKMLPKVFGDKIDVTSDNKPIQALPDLELARRAMHWITSLKSQDVVDAEVLPAPSETAQDGEQS
jgi:hypothetical protein